MTLPPSPILAAVLFCHYGLPHSPILAAMLFCHSDLPPSPILAVICQEMIVKQIDDALKSGLTKQQAYEKVSLVNSIAIGNLSRWFRRRLAIEKASARVQARELIFGKRKVGLRRSNLCRQTPDRHSFCHQMDAELIGKVQIRVKKRMLVSPRWLKMEAKLYMDAMPSMPY